MESYIQQCSIHERETKQLMNLLRNFKGINNVSIIHCNSNKLLFMVSEVVGCHRYLKKRRVVFFLPSFLEKTACRGLSPGAE